MVGRAEVFRRRGALVALALVATLGLSATLGAFAAAYRTEHAYPDYVERAAVADLVVNPGLATTEADALLRSLPHVKHTWSHGFLFGAIDDGHPRTVATALGEPSLGEVLGSSDGRYVDGDRLIVTAGRIPSGSKEVFATDDLRAQYKKQFGRDLALGATIPVSFWWPLVLGSNAEPKQIVKPIGIERATVVGFGRMPDEVLQDDEIPRQRLIVSPDIARRYDCITKLPVRGASEPVVFAALFPSKCATQYRYYSLDVDDPANVPAVERAIGTRLAALNRHLPKVLIENNFVYRPIITTRADADQRIQHSIRPTVVALDLFGGLAALATLAIIAVAVARIMRQTRETERTLIALGVGRRDRIAVLAFPYLPIAVAAAIAASALAYAVSSFAPLGEVSRVLGHPSRSLAPSVTVVVLLAFFALFVLVAVVSAAATTRSRSSAGRRARNVAAPLRTLERTASPAVAEGIRSATSAGRGAALLTAASCVAVAALSASVVFGSNLVALVDHPQRYGWPWDVGVLANYGYGGLNRARVHADLAARHDVQSYDELAFFSAVIDGKSIPALIGGEDARRVDLPIIAGRAPNKFDEIALGVDTASELGLHLGDAIEVEFGSGPKAVRERAKVVGTAVFPSMGQYLADRTGLGHGLFTVVPKRLVARTQSGDDIDYTYVGIKLKPGANPAAVAAALRPRAGPWDPSGTAPFIYPAPVRPPEIVNAASIRNGPLVLAALLGLALMVALAMSIAVSVNERRRELAVLRAVGFTRAQVRRSVRWQALTTVAIGVVVGVPAGIVAGRWGWRVFASDLGIGLSTTVPVLVLVVLAAVVVVGAFLAAARPAYVAACTRPADALRSQ